MGTGRFVSPSVLRLALEASGTEVVTVAIRMTGVDGSGPDAGILSALDRQRYQLLPNTAGATSVRQAVFMAELAREALDTNWVKLEVIGDERTLWPDVAGTVEATRILVREGFVVLPYTTTDLVTALRLEEAGAATVMPLGSMIGSGQGVQDWEGVRRIAERVSVPVVVDAGIGAPSDAVRAMEGRRGGVFDQYGDLAIGRSGADGRGDAAGGDRGQARLSGRPHAAARSRGPLQPRRGARRGESRESEPPLLWRSVDRAGAG